MRGKLTAYQQLRRPGEAEKLLPRLREVGLSLEDALAVATNTVTAFYLLGDPQLIRPEELLHRFSLEEIGALAQPVAPHWAEGGVNLSFEEAVR